MLIQPISVWNELLGVWDKLPQIWDKLSQAGTNCPSDSSGVLWIYNGIQFLMFIAIHSHASMMDCGTFWVLSRLQNQHGTNLERLGQIIPAGTNCPRLGQIVQAGTNCPRCKILRKICFVKKCFCIDWWAEKNFGNFFRNLLYPGNSPLKIESISCPDPDPAGFEIRPNIR